jgi:hypothetical protein
MSVVEFVAIRIRLAHVVAQFSGRRISGPAAQHCSADLAFVDATPLSDQLDAAVLLHLECDARGDILLVTRNTAVGFIFSGFLLLGSVFAWIAYAIQRAGWAPVAGMAAVGGAGLAIYLHSAWALAAMWIPSALCALKIAHDRHWRMRKWLLIAVPLGPLAVVLGILLWYRAYRASRAAAEQESDEPVPVVLSPPEPIKRTEEEKPAIREFEESVFKDWFDIRSFWQDRRVLLAQPTAIRANPRTLRSKSLAFAIAGVIVPAVAIT